MQKYPTHFIKKARRLASDNYTNEEISEKLSIEKEIISIWCKDLVGKSPAKSNIVRNQKIRRELLDSEISVFNKINIDNNLAKIFCGILYGCEGAKYPASDVVALTNADPELIVSFVSLFRKSFDLNESKWRIHLQVHSDQNYLKLLDFWSNLLNLPRTKFYKPTVTIAKQGKHRDKYLGTCTVKYIDYKFQLKLIGIFNEFMRKSSSLEDMPSG